MHNHAKWFAPVKLLPWGIWFTQCDIPILARLFWVLFGHVKVLTWMRNNISLSSIILSYFKKKNYAISSRLDLSSYITNVRCLRLDSCFFKRTSKALINRSNINRMLPVSLNPNFNQMWKYTVRPTWVHIPRLLVILACSRVGPQCHVMWIDLFAILYRSK
jgi:hypothetical protein